MVLALTWRAGIGHAGMLGITKDFKPRFFKKVADLFGDYFCRGINMLRM